MAAQPAAHQASMKSGVSSARDSRSKAPDRFPVLDTPRYFTEVNVPGYNVARSVAKQKKREQKRRQRDALARQPEATSAAPIVLTEPDAPGTLGHGKKVRPNNGPPTIELEL